MQTSLRHILIRSALVSGRLFRPHVSTPSSMLRAVCSPPSTNPQTPPQPVKQKLHMVYTCAKCDTRAVKSFSKDSYTKGVVIITCPTCDARHVIADNLGWFGPHKNVEQILAAKGESITHITDADLDYTP